MLHLIQKVLRRLHLTDPDLHSTPVCRVAQGRAHSYSILHRGEKSRHWRMCITCQFVQVGARASGQDCSPEACHCRGAQCKAPSHEPDWVSSMQHAHGIHAASATVTGAQGRQAAAEGVAPAKHTADTPSAVLHARQSTPVRPLQQITGTHAPHQYGIWCMTLERPTSPVSCIICSSSSSICTRESDLGWVHCSAPRLPPMAARICPSALPSLLKVSGAPCTSLCHGQHAARTMHQLRSNRQPG